MQNNSEGTEADKFEIDRIVKTFFNIFTNTGQQQTDWTIFNNICIPESIIIKKTGVAEEVYTLESFIGPRRKILTDGTLTNFEECEINEETTIVGNIAQRFSKYQKSGYLNGAFFKEFGNKLFHFIKTQNGWKITSLIWEDDKR